MAPTAMMLPWPAINRGTEATVPRPPGLVSVMVAPLNHRHHKPPAPVLPLHVHRDTQPEAFGLHPMRRAILLEEGMAHHRVLLGGLHQGPGDQVGEGDLLPAAG